MREHDDDAIPTAAEALEGLKTAIGGFREKYDRRLAELEQRLEAERKEREDAESRQNKALLWGLGSGAPGRKAAPTGERKAAYETFHRALQGNIETKDMRIASGADGGYTVSGEIDRTILNQLVEVSPIRRVAEVVSTTSSEYVKIVNRRGTGSGWAAEATTRAETASPSLAEIMPPSGELWARPVVSTWLLDDAGLDIEQFIAENVTTEFAAEEGAAFVAGDGIAKPKGFLTYATAATADDTRAFGTIEHLAAASATAVTPDELVQLVYKLRPSYRQGESVAWAMNSTTAGAIRQLKDSQNRFLWADGLQPGQPPMLLGFPVVEAEDMPDMATGALAIAFGNWRRGYIITDRVGTRLIRDDITKPGWVKFYFARRVGGAVTDSNALKFIKMA